MAYKFEIINNAVVVTDTATSEVLIAQPAKNTWFEEQNIDVGFVSIYGMSGTDQDNIKRYKYDNVRGFPIAECQNGAGETFNANTFRAWCYANLAFSSAGGAAALKTGGFIDYNDTTGSISLVANTWTDIPNNGLGAFTNKNYKPDGISELLDVTTGYIDASQTNLGDSILIRNDYNINPNTNNSLLQFRYELGSGAGLYTLEKNVSRLDSGSGQDYRFSLEPDLIYMGDINTKNNPIKLQVKLSTNGNLTNAGSVIQLLKYNT